MDTSRIQEGGDTEYGAHRGKAGGLVELEFWKYSSWKVE
jgi:hypothetical protein